MKTGNIITSGLICVSILILPGCVKLRHKNPDIKTYMMQAERTASPLEKPRARKLWIDPVTVLPPYDIRNLVLRSSDVEYRSGYYTELIIPPADNFRNAFYSWFADTGIFDNVSMSERNGATHRLVAAVTEFYGDTAEMKAVLNIRVSLLDESGRETRVMFSNRYARRIALAEVDAETLIRAYNSALTAILTDCEQDVIGVLP